MNERLQTALLSNEPVRIVLGAGDCSRVKDGWFSQDIQGTVDYQCDASELPGLTGYVDEFEATHMLEHFPYKQVPFVLKRWLECLKPGGKLYIEVPNFRWQVDLMYAANSVEEEMQVVEYAYGGQVDQYDFHKIGFTPRLMEFFLRQAGFVKIKINDLSSLCVTAEKANVSPNA